MILLVLRASWSWSHTILCCSNKCHVGSVKNKCCFTGKTYSLSSHLLILLFLILNIFLHTDFLWFSCWLFFLAICFISHHYYLLSVFIVLATRMIKLLTSNFLYHLTHCVFFCIYLFWSLSFICPFLKQSPMHRSRYPVTNNIDKLPNHLSLPRKWF